MAQRRPRSLSDTVIRRQSWFVLVLAASFGACSNPSAARELTDAIDSPAGRIAVEIDVEEYASVGSAALASRTLWWGTDLTLPKEIITDARISIGGVSIAIPYSAYSDLAEARTASLSVTSDGFSVTIEGADAGGSYRAFLYFEGATIVRRRVESREFPNERWDEFVYRFVPDDGR